MARCERSFVLFISSPLAERADRARHLLGLAAHGLLFLLHVVQTSTSRQVLVRTCCAQVAKLACGGLAHIVVDSATFGASCFGGAGPRARPPRRDLPPPHPFPLAHADRAEELTALCPAAVPRAGVARTDGCTGSCVADCSACTAASCPALNGATVGKETPQPAARARAGLH
jgi:hypothetical protein